MPEPVSRGGAAGPGGPVLRWLEVFDRLLAGTAAALGAALVVATVAIVTYSVFMRYVFNTPQTWTDELVGYFLVYTVMLGVAAALRRGDHITVDLLTSRLGPGGRRAVDIWGMVAVMAVAAAMLDSSLDMIAFSRMVGLISDGYVEAPMWILQMALVIGYAMLLLSAANRLLRIAVGLPVASVAGHHIEAD